MYLKLRQVKTSPARVSYGLKLNKVMPTKEKSRGEWIQRTKMIKNITMHVWMWQKMIIKGVHFIWISFGDCVCTSSLLFTFFSSKRFTSTQQGSEWVEDSADSIVYNIQFIYFAMCHDTRLKIHSVSKCIHFILCMMYLVQLGKLH